MYSHDNRTVTTQDAGGTNFVFGAMQANRFIVDTITMSSNAYNLDLRLAMVNEDFQPSSCSWTSCSLRFRSLSPVWPTIRTASSGATGLTALRCETVWCWGPIWSESSVSLYPSTMLDENEK